MTLGALTIFEKPYREKELFDAIQKALVLDSANATMNCACTPFRNDWNL